MFKDILTTKNEVTIDNFHLHRRLQNENGKYEIYYCVDNNTFETVYGEVIYDLWDYFWPTQIHHFMKKKQFSTCLMSKLGRWVKIVCI